MGKPYIDKMAMEDFEDNIEKEYHERFKDFEELPDDVIWSKIQERIAPEPERRPIVFWWIDMLRPVGIAAGVIFGLLIGGYFLSTKDMNVSGNHKIVEPKLPIQNGKTSSVNKENDSKTKNNIEEIQRKEQLLTRKEENENKVEGLVLFDKKKIKESKIIDNSKAAISNVIESKSIALVEEKTPIKVSEKEERIIEISTIVSEQKSKENALQVLENQIIKGLDDKTNEINVIAENRPEIQIDKITGNENTPILLSQAIPFLNPKGTNIQQPTLSLSLPALNPTEPDYVFEEPRKRLVFIPPTEVFANVTPMLSYYMFSPNKGDNILVKNFNPSSERLSFAAQMGFIYPIAKKLDLRTGFSFMTGKSKISYDLTNNNQKIVKIIDDLNVEIEPSRSIKTENQNWQYIEVQSDFMYALKKYHAFSLGFRAGVQTTAIKKPVFNGKLGYRISKPINDRFALWLEPSVAVSLSSHQSIENLFLYRTTGFGLNMGVSLLRGY